VSLTSPPRIFASASTTAVIQMPSLASTASVPARGNHLFAPRMMQRKQLPVSLNTGLPELPRAVGAKY
jgi:hypothetical protein